VKKSPNGRELVIQLNKSKFTFLPFYRYRLSDAFFSEKAAKCHWQDVFPNCVRSAEEEVAKYMKKRGVVRVGDTDELTLDDLKEISPIFISNITVNDWQISCDAKSSHQLISFSSQGVKLIGSEWEKAAKLSECFTPEYMRLSAAMAISGAAVSYGMGIYETSLDMVLDLLNLLGIGMGDEMVSDQCNCQKKVRSASGKIKQVCERCHFHLPGGWTPCKMDGCSSYLLGVRKRPFIWKSPPG